MARNGFGLPVVLKPNEGQRGSGVSIIRTRAGLRDYLDNTHAAQPAENVTRWLKEP